MPHPLFDAEQNFFKRMDAVLPIIHCADLQCAARKPFPAARRMPQRDGVGRGIEADLMRAGMLAGAIGADVDAHD